MHDKTGSGVLQHHVLSSEKKPFRIEGCKDIIFKAKGSKDLQKRFSFLQICVKVVKKVMEISSYL